MLQLKEMMENNINEWLHEENNGKKNFVGIYNYNKIIELITNFQELAIKE